MMLPLWLYFNKDYIDFKKYSDNLPAVQLTLEPSFIDMGTFLDYFEGVQKDFVAALRDPGNHVHLHRILANLSGFAGCFVFNRLHFAQCRDEYEQLMQDVTIPVFTNALNRVSPRLL